MHLRAIDPCLVLGLMLCLASAPGRSEVLAVGVDADGNALIQLDSPDETRWPVDRTSRARPFVFWLNTDQDDLEDYESWPIERPDHASEGIDSLRDLEDFARLVVRIRDPAPDRQAQALRFSLQSHDGAVPALNLYRGAASDCGTGYLIDAEAARRQREAPWNVPVGQLVAGSSMDVPIEPRESAGDAARDVCFLFEGASEGLATLTVAATRDGQPVGVESAPVWLSLRHVKRLYQRVDVPWPEDRPFIFDFLTPPPAVELEWKYDPMGFPFEAPWYETDDVIVWVYGWLKSGPGLYEQATVRSGETIFKRLWHRGYRGRLVMFHWPTHKEDLVAGLLRSEYRGYKAGAALANHVAVYAGGNRRVHVTAHSLGGVPLAAALRQGMRVDNALFQVAAVPAEMFDPDPALRLRDMRDVATPNDPDQGGYPGYLARSETRIYSLYNPTDTTFYGWNIAQKQLKGGAALTHKYLYRPDAPDARRMVLSHLGRERQVTDPDEARAFIARSRTHALGAEPRVRGSVHSVFDLHRAPYEFGNGHVVQWEWDPQRTTAFYNLVLDLFNTRYNSELL
jgi:hypothetical protein